jgi:hypothetical protein
VLPKTLLDPLCDLDKFLNTAAFKRMKCGANLVIPTVGLRQNLRFNKAVALKRMNCWAKLVTPAVGHKQILRSIL